ncbi:MAG: hypothetical protein VR64_23780 [Desulfatitalea sp. BRH_c12]|nr:MAG: hypothetical protein VR64_23780 [Desulfatitalea sp. BRH_c12]
MKMLVLMVVFFSTCIFVYGFNKPSEIVKKPALMNYFDSIDGYATLRHIPLKESSVAMLALDDYVFADYKGEQGVINLYIGYYYTADKAYSAHSPLVCYPSQGWKIDTRPVKSTLTFGHHKIYFEEIVTSHGEEKELVLYWYQTGHFTNTQVYRNKIDMGYNKLVKNDEQHGFVRVSVPFGNDSGVRAKQAATKFIQDFYPSLVKFITGDEIVLNN